MGIRIKDLPLSAQAQAYAQLFARGLAIGLGDDMPKPAKYHSERDYRGKLKFASRREAARYDELMLLLGSGEIRNLKLQPQYTLQESYITTDGERVRAIRYIADYSYERRDMSSGSWALIIEDVKSPATRTQKYIIKKKLLRERFGIDISEV